MSQIDALQITPASEAPTALTPPQRRFNTLVRQIEQARQSLTAWQDNIAAYRLSHSQVVLPLEAEWLDARREWAFALDAMLAQKSWTKAERSLMSELVCDAAEELLHTRDDDAALKALFAKHADVDFDTEQREMMMAMKGFAETMTGMDLGDDEGIQTEADLFQRMQQSMQAQMEANAAEHSAKAATRRNSAAQKRREAEAEQTTQSVREIFRKLASALHPDRETDPQQRDTKTALMQRVNQAYAANDLLTLLELQLQIEQIDAAHMASASAKRLGHYNKVLAEQLAGLKAEAQHAEAHFCHEFNIGFGRRLDPKKLGPVLEQCSKELRAELTQQWHDIRMLADTAATKRWLKQLRQREAAMDFDFF